MNITLTSVLSKTKSRFCDSFEDDKLDINEVSLDTFNATFPKLVLWLTVVL